SAERFTSVARSSSRATCSPQFTLSGGRVCPFSSAARQAICETKNLSAQLHRRATARPPQRLTLHAVRWRASTLRELDFFSRARAIWTSYAFALRESFGRSSSASLQRPER